MVDLTAKRQCLEMEKWTDAGISFREHRKAKGEIRQLLPSSRNQSPATVYYLGLEQCVTLCNHLWNQQDPEINPILLLSDSWHAGHGNSGSGCESVSRNDFKDDF